MVSIDVPRLTYDVSDHCNLRCLGCDHASPWFGKRFAELSSFEADLHALNEVCEVGELCFAGGEPLQHPHFGNFVHRSRKENFARELRVITNGVLLRKLTEEVLESLDCVVISIYPGVPLTCNLRDFAALAEQMNVFVGVYVRREFRHALVNYAIEPDEVVRAIHHSCLLRVYCHTVYDGRYYRCPRAHTLEPRMRIIGRTLKNRPCDGVSLHFNPNLRDDMVDYLGESTPLVACKYCLGTVGAMFPVTQMNSAQLRAEQQAAPDPLSLVDPNIDLHSLPAPQPPEPGWVKQVFEPLTDFLDRVEQSGQSLQDLVTVSGDSGRSASSH